LSNEGNVAVLNEVSHHEKCVGEWSDSLSCHFTLEKGPCTHWMEGWLGPSRSGRGGEDKKKSLPCLESNLDRPVHSLITILAEVLWPQQY